MKLQHARQRTREINRWKKINAGTLVIRHVDPATLKEAHDGPSNSTRPASE